MPNAQESPVFLEAPGPHHLGSYQNLCEVGDEQHIQGGDKRAGGPQIQGRCTSSF